MWKAFGIADFFLGSALKWGKSDAIHAIPLYGPILAAGTLSNSKLERKERRRTTCREMTESDLKKGFTVGQWAVRPLLGTLSDGHEEHRLEPKVMDVLLELARSSGELVPRETLIERVWDGRPVGDDVLSRCIADLRRVLGDDARNPQFIQTVPKRGYRLLPTAEPASLTEQNAAYPQASKPDGPRRKRWPAVAAIIGVLAVAGFYVLESNVGDGRSSASTDIAAQDDGRHTLAVLPFENRSANPSDIFLVDGLHDDLLTRLARVDAWDVISRTSVDRFRDGSAPIGDIATTLNADLIIEGGIQRSGDSIRINIQLIDSRSDTHLWAETYNRDLSVADLFDVQSDIVDGIANQLAMTLQAEAPADTNPPTTSFAAYNEFVKGRRRAQTESVTSLKDAVQHFEKAIYIDPQYAEAYAALADAYLSLGGYFWGGLTVREAIDRAEPLVVRALELDPTLPHAHIADGLMQTLSWDSAAAEVSYQRAIDLQPSFARAYRLFANLRWRQLRREEAIELAEHAESLDPLSGAIRLELGRYYDAAGRFDEAMDKYVGAARLLPDNALARLYVAALNYLVYGEIAKSLIWYHEAAELDPNSPSMQAAPAMAYLELGDLERAAEFVERGIELDADTFWPRYTRLCLSLRRGQFDAAYADAEALLAIYPQDRSALETLRDRDLRQGKPDHALARYAKAHPELTETSEPHVGDSNLFAAVDLARVYAELGDSSRASALTERVLELTASGERFGVAGYWLTDAAALSIQGRPKEALARLERAINDGYRVKLWYHFELDPNFDNLRGLPAFDELHRQVRSLIDAEASEAESLRKALKIH